MVTLLIAVDGDEFNEVYDFCQFLGLEYASGYLAEGGEGEEGQGGIS